MGPRRVLVVAGTRPEVIKLAPVISALRRLRGVRARLCVTAQHRQMLDLGLGVFGLKPDLDLDLMRRGQTPNQVLARVLSAMEAVLARERPDIVVVQGDTTTALGAALAAFHHGVAVAHVEAGLRSFDRAQPFPEENNRILIDHVADFLFAPTPLARRHLLREGIKPGAIWVTGNTVVDALRMFTPRRPQRQPPREGKTAVVTIHRRENFGPVLEGVFRAVRRAAVRLPGFVWVCPVHPNPSVRAKAEKFLRHPRIKVIAPLAYPDFVKLMSRASFILTDSGGIQEEAPTLKKPVLVARRKTERKEILGRGAVLVGTAENQVLRWLLRAARGRMVLPRSNPFGDGRASVRIARILARGGPRV